MSQDWAEALRFAVLRLGLSPTTFWGLTLLEWRILTAGTGERSEALTREALSRLLDRCPGYQKRT